MPDVEPAALERLLELQTEDSAIARLQHQKDTMPEARRLAEIADSLAELEADLEIATKNHDEIAREQARLEGEMELLEAKIAREEKRMFSGAVANPKELAGLQAEVASLNRKRSDLEDRLLEVMEQREQAAETRDRLAAERAETSAEHESLGTTVASLAGDLDAQLGTHGERRSEVAGTLPSDLRDLYERIRAQKAGVGVAALRGGTCEGCHTKLAAKEVERLKTEGGLQRCDNCRRILVIL